MASASAVSGAAEDAASSVQPVASAAAAATVKIHLKPIGAAPALTRSKFKLAAGEKFSTVMAFLRKQLALKDSDSLLLYLHSAFAPTPSQLVEDLHRAFAADGELVVHYSLTPAFG